MALISRTKKAFERLALSKADPAVMQIQNLISPGRVVCSMPATSKKKTLELISELFSNEVPELTQNDIFTSLINRERLGSTGLGHGVALPHGRVEGANNAVGVFVKLDTAIDYDAIDGHPVDLFFALVVPENSTSEHLSILSQLAEMFSDKGFCESLRAGESDQQIYDLISHWKAQANSA